MKERIILEVLDYLKLIVFVVVITTVLNTLLFTFSTVQQSSMEHTLHDGDVLIIDKISYVIDKPKVGDIVVFVEDEEVTKDYITRLHVLFEDIAAKFTRNSVRTRLVKRVIGVPGDVIDLKDGIVYVNDSAIDEPYVFDPTYERMVSFPLEVPENQYFVMGDNRSVSKDSRHFGTVPVNNIEGKAVFRLSPITTIGTVE